ncbi:MAG: PQQ-dependent sugar dehydrogenase, partial [Chromatiales bacterium]|nr:PQQ-dependent sugar dehydrogenase [Chromatiales bacterium]
MDLSRTATLMLLLSGLSISTTGWTATPDPSCSGGTVNVTRQFANGESTLCVATQDLISTGNTQIHGGADISFVAGRSIALHNGFRALPNARFNAYIGSTPPDISVENASQTESDSGTNTLLFPVTLSNPYTLPVSMSYSTQNISASAGTDYTATSGSLVIPAGQGGGTISVTIHGDTDAEPNETLQLTLSNPQHAYFADNQAVGTLINDDEFATGLDTRPANTTCLAGDQPSQGTSIELVNTFPGITFSTPLVMAQPPGDSSRFMVAEKAGSIRVVKDGVKLGTPFLDITSAISSGGERGLLGMAFHPNYASNGYFYLSYTDNSGDSVISRFTVSANPDIASSASEQIILTLDQPYSNHNGGNILFGPDGYLYIGFGDGGSGGDPLNHSQDKSTWLGAMLRIDVDSGSPYTVPADNPYAGSTCNQSARTGECPEIFAHGLRNPWRWSFDRSSGDLWAADVGQNAWEEVNIITSGGNYGWRCYEGTHAYNLSGCQAASAYDMPVVEYNHSEGYSVTGGYVYRGASIPSLQGTYLYANYGTGSIWGLPYYSSPGSTATLLLNAYTNVLSFAEDHAGELYILATDGIIYRFQLSGGGNGVLIPDRLSETGCVLAQDPTQPANGVIPYDVNALFWSDNADKTRWLVLPNGATIDIQADGHWNFPAGSVLIKEMALNGKLVETRLLMRHTNGNWGGYTYEWNSDET